MLLTDWILAIEGTEAGHRAAMMLALLAAFLHAVFGAIQKGRHDPWLTRWAIDCWLAMLTFAVPRTLARTAHLAERARS